MADLMTGPLTDGGTGELAVAGEIDMTDVDELCADALRALETTSRLVIDLSHVSFIDSTGLGALVRIRNKARADGKVLVLANPAPAVMKLLRITALDFVFDVDTSYVSAVTKPELARALQRAE